MRNPDLAGGWCLTQVRATAGYALAPAARGAVGSPDRRGSEDRVTRNLRPVPNPDAIAFRALKTKVSGLSTEHKLAGSARVRGCADVACGKNDEQPRPRVEAHDRRQVPVASCCTSHVTC